MRSRLALVELEARSIPATTLLGDLNPFDGGDPQNLITVGNTLFYSAITGETGRALWRTNGTPGGTRLVKDLLPGPDDATIVEAVGVGGMLYFTTNSLSGIGELWKSDGTAAGTLRIRGASAARLTSVAELTPIGNVLYFAGAANSGARELWRTDGTRAGTRRVRDAITPNGGMDPTELTRVGRTLFFVGGTPARGRELWKTDGTSAGTVRVKDIVSGPNSSYPQSLTNVGGTLFFVAPGDDTGRELWKSDGTTAGTRLVKDIVPGGNSGDPLDLTAVGRTLYFTAINANFDRELWRSNGTASGTFQLPGQTPDAYSPETLTTVGDRHYTAPAFVRHPVPLVEKPGMTSEPASCWTSGRRTRPGSRRHAVSGNDWSSLSSPTRASPCGPRTAAQTGRGRSSAQPAPGRQPRRLGLLPRAHFYNGSDVHGRELWRTDGTAEGPPSSRTSAGPPRSDPKTRQVLNGHLFFLPTEPVRTNGHLAAGTVLVAPVDRTSV